MSQFPKPVSHFAKTVMRLGRVPKVHELIANEANWTQGTYAETATGQICDRNSPQAACHCLLGAVLLCYPNEYPGIILQLIVNTGKSNVANFNDNSTHAEVLPVCKELDI